MHLTPTAYGDLADDLINKVSSATSVGAPLEKKEAYRERGHQDPDSAKTATTPGWILGDSSTLHSVKRKRRARSRFWERQWPRRPQRRPAWMARPWRKPLEPILSNRFEASRKQSELILNTLRIMETHS